MCIIKREPQTYTTNLVAQRPHAGWNLTRFTWTYLAQILYKIMRFQSTNGLGRWEVSGGPQKVSGET